jgi:hypothetical protein
MEGSMLDFVKNMYRGFVAVWLVLNVILCAIGGGKIGGIAGGGYIIWGVLIGIVWGVITSILIGGYIVTIISIERNTAKTVKLLSGGKDDDVSFDELEDETPFERHEVYSAPIPHREPATKAHSVPAGATSIANEAFKGRTDLASIAIPDGVTSIGKSAFSGCTGLTEVTIPDSVTSIGELAFQDCVGITAVTIGSGVTSIGTGAFSYCKSLTSVTSLAQVPPLTSSGIFQNVPGNVCLYVPADCIEAYRTANTWRKFASIESI